MLGASVWGDPDGGRYMQTFNTTEVASEKNVRVPKLITARYG